jgi:hypothetical protein
VAGVVDENAHCEGRFDSAARRDDAVSKGPAEQLVELPGESHLDFERARGAGFAL